MPETVPVCRQCHKNCLSSNGTMNGSLKNYNDCNSRSGSERLENSNKDGNDNDKENDNDHWQHLILLGKYKAIIYVIFLNKPLFPMIISFLIP